MRSITLLILMSCIVSLHAQTQGLAPIGNWTDHLSYNQAIRVSAIGEKIFAATPNAIFSINKTDNVIERISKLTGLSGTGISAMASNQSTIIVGYADANIDLIENGRITNINSIRSNPNITGKTIYDIVVSNDYAYLSTGFGIVVLNLVKKEIAETYIVGTNGTSIPVYSFCRFNSDW